MSAPRSTERHKPKPHRKQAKTMTVTPLALAHIAQPIILQRAVQHCKSLSAPELLSFLGNLDSEAARFERSDEVWRIFRDVASIARTELSRKSPGTYVTLAILK